MWLFIKPSYLRRVDKWLKGQADWNLPRGTRSLKTKALACECKLTGELIQQMQADVN